MSGNSTPPKFVTLSKEDFGQWDRVAEYSFGVYKTDESGNLTDKLLYYSNAKIEIKDGKEVISAAPLGFSAKSIMKSPFDALFFKGHGVTEEMAKIPLILPPQAISIQTQFATNVIATNNGVLEENNGTVFRLINISGTTGVWPGRPQATRPDVGWMKVAKQFAPGAVSAISNLANSVKSTGKALTAFGQGAASAYQNIADPKAQSSSNTIVTTDKKGDKGEDPEVKYAQDSGQTGHAQFWKLYNFFVAYTEFKKTKDGKSARLVFTSPKDSIDYVVTPLAFDLRRDARNPLLYNYSIVLKAWKVRRAGWSESNLFSNGVDIRNPSLVRSLTDIVRRGRMLISRTENVLKGFQSDIRDVSTLINQGYLAVKDTFDLGYTVFDVKDTIASEWDTMYAYNSAQLEAAAARFGSKIDPKTKTQQIEQAQASAKTSNPSSGPKSTNEAAESASSTQSNPSGESASGETSGGLAAASEKALQEITKNPDALESIDVASLILPESIKSALLALKEENRVTAGQVLVAAKKIQDLSDNIAAQSGILDSAYSKIYDVPVPGSTGKKATEDDILMMVSLQETKDALIALTASTDAYQTLQPSPIGSANDAISDSEQMSEPTSAYPVTVNRGDTLQSLAARYLDDANRFREIAALNDLAPPYIDEVGTITAIQNPTGRTFIVSSNRYLVLNQTISIIGKTQAPTRRSILKIEEIGISLWKITVSGIMDLDRFNGPGIQPYLLVKTPKTVAVGDTILIPSGSAPDQSNQARPTPLQSRLTTAEKVFRVDIALDGTNSQPKDTKSVDISIDSTGDVSRSYGYSNAAQAIRNAVEIERGALSQHPGYGLPNLVGQRNNTVSKNDIAQVIKSLILADSRFVDAQVDVITEGSAVYVNIEAVGANGTGRIPLQFRYDI